MAASASHLKAFRSDRADARDGGRAAKAQGGLDRALLPPSNERPLAPALAHEMGQRLGADFNGVRLHEGADAQASADALSARAYTVGEHVVLGRKAPPLSSDAGKHTLAHELAHVVQQRRGGPPPTLSPDAPHEAAADRTASSAMSKPGTTTVGGATGVGVARDTDEEAMRKRNKAKGKLKGVDKSIDKAVEEGIVEEKTAQPDPKSVKTKRVKSTKAAKDTRKSFNKARDTHAKALGVAKGGQVHHGVEVQAMKRYPGAFSQAEINAAENMRGIRPELKGKRQLHNRAIRATWDRHYNELDALIKKMGLKKGTPQYKSFVRKYLLDARAEMDYLYDKMYSEAHAAEAAKSGKQTPKTTGKGGKGKSPASKKKAAAKADGGASKAPAKSAPKATPKSTPKTKSPKAPKPATTTAGAAKAGSPTKSPAKSPAKKSSAKPPSKASKPASPKSSAKLSKVPSKSPPKASAAPVPKQPKAAAPAPKASKPSPPPPGKAAKAAPAAKPATPALPPEKAPTPPTVKPSATTPEPVPTKPSTGGGKPGKGGGGGSAGPVLRGIALQIIAGIIHQKAVEKRIEKQAEEKGWVPYGSPSGEGRLYDLGAWFMDPTQEAERNTPFEKRFKIAPWRQNIRNIANAKKPGETLDFTWQVGICKQDIFGNWKTINHEAVYLKGADGRWSKVGGELWGMPNMNDVISEDVPDSQIEKLIYADPCYKADRDYTEGYT